MFLQSTQLQYRQAQACGIGEGLTASLATRYNKVNQLCIVSNDGDYRSSGQDS